MGILSSLFTGVSGLNANGMALSVIGNNIANLSTVGFKGSRATFADLISSSITGGAGAIQTGIGVALTSVQGNFSQGSLASSSNVEAITSTLGLVFRRKSVTSSGRSSMSRTMIFTSG